MRSQLFGAVLLSFYFLYLWLRIDPRLIYQAQEPVFFFDSHFAKDFLSYPGGVNELVCRFLSQFFYQVWIGAMLLTAILGLITWLTGHIVRRLAPHRPVLYVHWVPSVLLLALYSDYMAPLTPTLGILWVLLGIVIYVRLAPHRIALRGLLYLGLQVLLYYTIGGQVFVFSLSVALYELAYHHRSVLAALYAVVAGGLPYLGAWTVFMLHVPDAYTRYLISFNPYRVTWRLWAIYACLLILLLAGALVPRPPKIGKKTDRHLWDRLLYPRSEAMRWIQGALLLSGAVSAALLSYDKDGKRVLLVDYYAGTRDWKQVLQIAEQSPVNPDYIQVQANRALYHTGRLCDDLFRFIQHSGGKGLFLQPDMVRLLPLRHSDLFFDLGLLNESEHWAYEALSVTGDAPSNLQRLAVVYGLEGDTFVAERFLGLLEKTLWHRVWAEDCRKSITDSNGISSSFPFADLRPSLPTSDFLVSPTEPERCLEELVKNPRNRMAFEYFMAYCLLEGDLSRFVEHLGRLKDLGYPTIPRHFEEALLVTLQLTGRKDSPLPGMALSQETIRRFNDFNRILAKYNRNKIAAYAELAPYRDTYWFYGMYVYKPKAS